jgi:iron complex outermembrane recepter protein
MTTKQKKQKIVCCEGSIMKQESFFISLWLIGSSVLMMSPVWAETFSKSSTQANQKSEVGSRKSEVANKSSFLIGNSELLIAQSPPAATDLIRVTDVKLFETDTGIELVLITANGQSLKPTTTTVGNALVADIPNAVLEVSNRKQFRFEKPIEGITLVTVANFQGDRIRVEITGQNAPPKAVVTTEGQEFIVAISPNQETSSTTTQESTTETSPTTTQESTTQTSPTTAQQPDEPIELVVTGTLEEKYRVSESSIGTRTETPIINVPQSIQVVPEQVIEEQGATTVGETLRNTAGVTTGRLSSDAPAIAPVIRGFESTNVLRNGARDTTLRRVAGTPNIQQIEILRGPASVLFGQGDLGGTVSVVTKQPLNIPFYQLDYQVGQFGLHRPSLDVTGPFGRDPNSIAYRLNVSYETSDSFKNFEESSSFFISPVVKLINTDKTQLTAELEYLKFESEGSAPELPARGTVRDNPNGKIASSVNLGEPSLAKSETTVTRIGYQLSHKFSNNWSIKNELLFADADAPENTFTLPLALSANQRTLQRNLLKNPSKQTNFNLNTNVIGKFATGSIGHELLLGVELSRDTFEDIIDSFNLAPIDIFAPNYRPPEILRESIFSSFLNQNTKTETDAIGFYVQDQISVLNNLILVLGGRFDIADQTYNDRLNQELSFEREDQAFSPRVGIVYKPAENFSVYGSYTRSFKPQIGRERTNAGVFGDPFQPERGTQYEVGFKADLLNQRLSTTLALFHLERTNVLVSGDNNSVAVQQAGLQRSQGVELNIAGEIFPGWNILASYAYTDATIAEDNRYAVGNYLVNVPKHAASLWTTYEIQSGILQGLGLGLGLFYQGERQGDSNNTFSLPDFLRTDATLFYRVNGLRASVNFQNLFDVNYYEGARGDLRVIPGAPFTVFGKITLEF